MTRNMARYLIALALTALLLNVVGIITITGNYEREIEIIKMQSADLYQQGYHKAIDDFYDLKASE